MFKDRLKELRKSNGYSMDDLCQIYNKQFNGRMNKSTLSRYENGLQEPLFTVVKNLASIFNVSVDSLSSDEVKYMSTSEKLKNRRKELGLTMLEIAQKVGVSEATVSRWESGDIANMRRDKIASLANALNVTPAYIMGWDEKIPPEKSEEIEEGIVLHRDGKTSTYRMSKDKLKTIEALLEQLDEDDNPDL